MSQKSPRRYAQTTEVPVAQTKTEIEAVLPRYGATGFMHGWDADRADIAMIAVRIEGRAVRMPVAVAGGEPVLLRFRKSPPFQTTTRVRLRPGRAFRLAALLLVLKAKLEAVTGGITTIEQEFFAHLVTPSGQTLQEILQPQLEAIFERGRLPVLPGIRALPEETP